jgi:hypothetical protein
MSEPDTRPIRLNLSLRVDTPATSGYPELGQLGDAAETWRSGMRSGVSLRFVVVLFVMTLALQAGVLPASAAVNCAAKTTNTAAISLPGVCSFATPTCAKSICFWRVRITVSVTFPNAQGGLVYGDVITVAPPALGVATFECAASSNAKTASCSATDPVSIGIRKGNRFRGTCAVRPWPPQSRVLKAVATCHYIPS